MRVALGLTVLLTLTATATATAQPPAAPPDPAPRFKVLYNERFFPQTTPKAALASLARAADLAQYDYIAAYLMDEKQADARIAAWAKEFESVVESDLRARRAKERNDPFAPIVDNRLPLDPAEFGVRVKEEATRRGFERLVSEIRERFQEDPSHIRDVQKFVRDGEVQAQDATAKMTVQADRTKAAFFTKVGNRWFIEDRTQDSVAPAAKE